MNYEYLLHFLNLIIVTDRLTNESVLSTEEANSKAVVVVIVADVNFTFGDTLKRIG